jgi:patatin-like phospholipase/acyl hydrolase
VGESFQILALDGGGYKGMFAAALLERLEADLGISVVEHFDLITGTSTGAIIALGLGAGLTPTQITSFYVEHGEKIFPARHRGRARRAFTSKFSPAPLRCALEQVLGTRTLGESKVPLVIPSYDLTNDDVYVFRTPHSPRFRRDRHELMVDVALASSAAPTYLPAHELRGLRLIDGGVWANNPTMVGVVEAVSSFGRALAEVSVFSLGTTTDTSYRRPRLDRGGLLAWGREAFDIVMRGQNLAARNTAALMLGSENLLRVDPSVPAKVLRLDGVDPEQLRGRAEHVSRHVCSDFEQRFTQHRPPPYTPQPIQGETDV